MTPSQADILILQIGGLNRLRAMIGASGFLRGDGMLQFDFKGGITSNRCRIHYEADMYRVELFKIGRRGLTVLKQFEGWVYAEDLVAVFERQTGLYLSI